MATGPTTTIHPLHAKRFPLVVRTWIGQVAPMLYVIAMVNWALEAPFGMIMRSPAWLWLLGAPVWSACLFLLPFLVTAILLSSAWSGHTGPAKRALGIVVAGAAVVTALGYVTPPSLRWSYLLVMGPLTAVGLIAGCRWCGAVIFPHWWGRATAAMASTVILIQGALSQARPEVAPAALIGVLTFLLIPTGLAVFWLSRTPEIAYSQTAALAIDPQTRSLLRMTVFFVLFALVGGLSARCLEESIPVWGELDVLAGAMFVGGSLYGGLLVDRSRLEYPMVGGAGLLVVGFLLAQWSSGAAVSTLALMLNGIAFGLLEPIPWYLISRAALTNQSARWYDLGAVLLVTRLVLGGVVVVSLDGGVLEGTGLPGALAVLMGVLLFQGVSDPRTFLERWKQVGPAEQKPALGGEEAALLVSASAADLLERYYGSSLSRREVQIGRMAVAGIHTRDIAEQLFLTPSTVKTHLKNLYRKTETENRNDLYRKLMAQELSEHTRAQAPPQRQAPEPLSRGKFPRDPVTGALERGAVEVFLPEALAESRRRDLPLSVLLVRTVAVDQRILFGRTERQQIQAMVGGILKTSLRAGDWVCRWSTTEFVVVLEGSGAASAREVAERLAQKVLAWARTRTAVRVVTGWASTEEEEAPTADSLLSQAVDRAAQSEVSAAGSAGAGSTGRAGDRVHRD